MNEVRVFEIDIIKMKYDLNCETLKQCAEELGIAYSTLRKWKSYGVPIIHKQKQIKPFLKKDILIKKSQKETIKSLTKLK